MPDRAPRGDRRSRLEGDRGLDKAVFLLPGELAARILAIMAFAVVVYSLTWKEPQVVSDSYGYLEVAADLEDFRLEKMHFRPPGYPALLRLLGLVERQAAERLIIAGLLLHMTGVWMLSACLHRLGLSRRPILLFVGVLCLPPFVQSAAYVLSENLGQFLLVAGFAALMGWILQRRSRYLALSGLALAAAALTKPTYQLQAPALAAGLFLLALIFPGNGLRQYSALKAGGAMTVWALLPVCAFALFNYTRFDHFTISPGNLAYSLSTKTVRVLERLPAEHAVAREAMITVRNKHLVERGSSHTAEQYYPEARSAVGAMTGLEGRKLDAYLLRLNLILIAEAPLQYALHVGQSAVVYWFPSVGEISIRGSGLLHLSWTAFHFLIVAWFVLQLTVLGGRFAHEISRRIAGRAPTAADGRIVTGPRIHAYVLALSMVFYTMAASCLVHHGEPRFRTVNDLLILLLCFLGTSIWRDLITDPG